ncbi:hypothetical protein BSPWISOXPB_4557 [uncultured Gammaproteobacteria bacterium]|nr:hypothetical protein BSPWISOXPB_4557 [uncultured Gammaproteobacteria bacterium]
MAWGDAGHGGTGAPSGNGYTNIYSTSAAFAALKADGSIVAWGSSSDGGSGVPLVMAIPRFIQLGMLLPLLKPMVNRGVGCELGGRYRRTLG